MNKGKQNYSDEGKRNYFDETKRSYFDETKQSYHYEPKQNCCDEPKQDCCDEPKQDCCGEPKQDCCGEPKQNCCGEYHEKYEAEEMNCIKHPKPRKTTETILKCGTVSGSGPLTCSLELPGEGGGSNGSQPIVEASVVLDTNRFVESTVKIDFSSLISFKTNDEDYFLRLGFRLSKICGGHPVYLGTWTFEKSFSENFGGGPMEIPQLSPPFSRKHLQDTEAFSFSWCECGDCPGCCRYVVEIVEKQCYNIVYAVVSNVSLTAMAVGEKIIY